MQHGSINLTCHFKTTHNSASPAFEAAALAAPVACVPCARLAGLLKAVPQYSAEQHDLSFMPRGLTSIVVMDLPETNCKHPVHPVPPAAFGVLLSEASFASLAA